MFKRTYLLILFSSLFASIAFSQQTGNQWIDYNSSYLKLKIAKEGIYKLTYQNLIQAGVPVNSINPKELKIFHQGKEQHIHIEGESNGVFDPSDYILFYGTYNDGKLDKALYDAGTQPHQFHSLYTDTAAYFLNWNSSGLGNRVTVNQDHNFSGKTAPDYFIYRSAMWFNNSFYDGFSIPGLQYGNLSDYNTGEGWFSRNISGNGALDLNVPTPNFVATANHSPKLFAEAYSRSNPSLRDDQGYQHNFELRVGQSLDLLSVKKHNGFVKIQYDENLDKKYIGATTRVYFRSVAPAKGLHHISHLWLDYARDFVAPNTPFLFNAPSNSEDFIEFENYTNAEPRIWSLDGNELILGKLDNQKAQFSFNNNTGSLFLYDESDIMTVPSLEAIDFNQENYQSTNYSYIMITSKKLDASSKEYKDFLESPTGGGFKVKRVFAEDLYNEYYYGVHHPMALRNFLIDILENQNIKPQYLFLLGKGQHYKRTTFNANNRNTLDLVPTWGLPASDNALTAGLLGTINEPAIATGRVPAGNDFQVRNYLNKVKLHKNQSEPLRKINLQLAGGNDQNENTVFNNYLNSYFNIFKQADLGGSRIIRSKSDPITIDKSLKEIIIDDIDEGLLMVTYFGHAASQLLEIDLGTPEEYNNSGKYPLFLYNGCQMGNCFEGSSLSELFLLDQPNNGALHWIGSTFVSYTSELQGFTTKFYEEFCKGSYGKPVAEIMLASLKKYQNPNSSLNKQNCQQTIYLGDPSLKLLKPEYPDYEVVETEVRTVPAILETNTTDFEFILPIANYGKGISQRLDINIRWEQGNDSVVNFNLDNYKIFYFQDTVSLKLPLTSNNQGINKIYVTLDYKGRIAENPSGGESNNNYVYEFLVKRDGINIVYPLKDQIVSDANLSIITQRKDFNSKDGFIQIYLDTSPYFNSSLLQKSEITSIKNINAMNFVLPPLDSTDFFVRAYLSDSREMKDAVESNSTFSFIFNSEDGWSQGYRKKFFNETSKNKIVIDSNGAMSFSRYVGTNIQTQSSGELNSGRFPDIRMYFLDNLIAHCVHELHPGIRLLAINKNNEERFTKPSKYQLISFGCSWVPQTGRYFVPGSRTGIYAFPTDQEAFDSIAELIRSIPDDYLIFIHSGVKMNMAAWPEELYLAFESIGATKIRSHIDGEAYVLMGSNSFLPGEATEVQPNPNNPQDTKEQNIVFSYDLTPYDTTGNISSTIIGPSSQWKLFYIKHESKDNPNENTTYEISGLKQNGEEVILYNAFSTQSLDISSIDANIYPYLRIKTYFKDGEVRTPRKVIRWSVLFDGLPEGSLNPEISYTAPRDSLIFGDTTSFAIAFQNISAYDLDSVRVLSTNQNLTNNKIDTLVNQYYPALSLNESFVISNILAKEKYGLGKNVIQLFVNPKNETPELSLDNNIISFEYFVKQSSENPLLEVLFDGIRIADNDIVSPNTLIEIKGKDNNPFFKLDKQEQFIVSVRYPNTSNFIDAADLSGDIEFIPAESQGQAAYLRISNADLPTGIYTLRANVVDINGNKAYEDDYEINFQVVRDFTITNVFPYPNPFTSSTKFVFTLTGESLPDRLDIHIFDVRGRKVKSIDLMGSSNIKIGQNITTYAWDGTDEYGQKLGNGVYLYSVNAIKNGEQYKMRATDVNTDQYFHEGFGKLYIAR